MLEWLLSLYWPVIVPAVMIGFALGHFSRSRSQKRPEVRKKTALSFDQRCLSGLTHLLNEQTQQAVDALLKGLDVRDDTFDAHLALAALMRRQGDLSQAIAIHQRLLASTILALHQRHLVQFELARDYSAAGLFDRAESLLKELAKTSGAELRTESLHALIDVYRDERDWPSAIALIDDMSGWFGRQKDPKVARMYSHFCCEQAEILMSQHSYRDAAKLLKQALAKTKSLYRAQLLQAQLLLIGGRDKLALDQLLEQCQEGVVQEEQAKLLLECYNALSRPEWLWADLEALNTPVQVQLELAMVRDIAKHDSPESANERLQASFAVTGSFELALALSKAGQPVADAVQLKPLLEQAQRQSASFRCRNCGFSGNKRHWLCPSCKSWDSCQPSSH